MQAVFELVNAAYRMKGGKGDAGAYVIRPRDYEIREQDDAGAVVGQPVEREGDGAAVEVPESENRDRRHPV